MTNGQWMIIWLAGLLAVLFGAHRLIIRRLRKTTGYRAAASKGIEPRQ